MRSTGTWTASVAVAATLALATACATGRLGGVRGRLPIERHDVSGGAMP